MNQEDPTVVTNEEIKCLLRSSEETFKDIGRKLLLQKEDVFLQTPTTPVKRRRSGKTKERVKAYFDQHPERKIKNKTLANALGISRQNVSHAVGTLYHKDKYINRLKHGLHQKIPNPLVLNPQTPEAWNG